MGKSVYSLVLSDDVVEKIDQAAYQKNTSRSNLINQILAEYVSFVTPEKHMQDIFRALTQIISQCQPLAVQGQSSGAMLSIRSPLQVKYNPTLKYTVELFRSREQGVGELKIMARTQSAQLLELLDGFFLLFCSVETRYLARLFPSISPNYQIGQGRLQRRFLLLNTSCCNEEIGEALAKYIQMVDAALKQYISAPPVERQRAMEQIYTNYLQQTPVIV